MGHPGADPGQAPLRSRGLRVAGAREVHVGHTPVPARSVHHHVREQALDGAPVRGLLHRRRIQRLLQAQPGRRPEGLVGRVRPGHPPRLRLRPPSRGGRRRQGRRGDRLDPGHEDPVRRHPAGPDVGVHDHERRGAADPGVLHRDRRGTGRLDGQAHGHHPERHSQGVHGSQHVHLSSRRIDALHCGHLRVHLEVHAQVQLHFDFRLPHAGSRRHRRHRNGLHAGRRSGIRPYRHEGRN